MLDKFLDRMADAPLCTILPIEASEENPEGWLTLDGKPFDPKELKSFHEILQAKFAHPQTGRLVSKWWYDWGGNRTRFPKISSDEAHRAGFGVEPGDKELKLVIKVQNG